MVQTESKYLFLKQKLKVLHLQDKLLHLHILVIILQSYLHFYSQKSKKGVKDASQA